MDFDFSDDQEQLRDAVRKWVDKGYSFERRRAAEKAGGFDRAASTNGRVRLTGLYVPEADGGMGMGPVEGMVVMEELGRGIVLEPLAQSLIAGAVIAGYGDAATKAAWLPGVASGEKLVVLAYQERAARYQLNSCEAKATQAPGGYVLNATKHVVPAGDQAMRSSCPLRSTASWLCHRRASISRCYGWGCGTRPGRAAEVSFKNASATLLTADARPHWSTL